MSKKRTKRPSTATGGLFQAVARLDSDDARAAKARKIATAASLARSAAARSQTELHSDLVECRILMQRALGVVPPPGVAAERARADGARRERGGTAGRGDSDGGDGGDDGETDARREGEKEEEEERGPSRSDPNPAAADALRACDGLLASLLEARRRLCLPPSSSDDGGDGDASRSKYARLLSPSSPSSPSASVVEEILRAEYEACKSSWRDVLDERHRALSLHSGVVAARSGAKFRSLDRSLWEQVEATVAQDRLLNGRRGGRASEGDDRDADAPPPIVPFDDSKLYQNMLKDFIASGAGRGGTKNGESAAAEAAERLRRAARKKKRRGNDRPDVDRRASKGRKIRYAVNPKLTNFTFPVSRTATTALGDDEWFKSLFGGVGRVRGVGASGAGDGGGKRRRSRVDVV